MIEQRLIVRKFWSLPAWHLTGVAVGEALVHGDRHGEKVRESDSGTVYSWSGYSVTLHKDACERYWHALIGDKPKVYVICCESGDDEELPIRPLVITVDYDEAVAYAETDEQVLSMTIPAELYRYMEKFVLEHYQPKQFKKRKRTEWSDDDPVSHPTDGRPLS